jgi:hypothetical protein
VFRATGLSIVLALGPNAAFLCAAWCHPDKTESVTCEHQRATTFSQAVGEDSCRTGPAELTAFVREEEKRGQQMPHLSTPVPQFEFTLPRTDGSWRSRPNTAVIDLSPPLFVALRI